MTLRLFSRVKRERTEQYKSVACDLKPGFSYLPLSVMLGKPLSLNLPLFSLENEDNSAPVSQDCHGNANGRSFEEKEVLLQDPS